MSTMRQIIFIQPDAPAKPPPGAPCNGCGVCCLVAPCPLGMVLSRRRTGACVALRWQSQTRQYRCGALSEPLALLQQGLPRRLQWLAPRLAPGLTQLAGRWIAVGQGCDSSVEPQRPAAAPEID
jgi:hypothetical protein